MEKEQAQLLSIRDENTILITARFFMPREENKSGDSQAAFYDIELIVKNDITCDKLLNGIRAGINARIKKDPDAGNELQVVSADLRYDDHDKLSEVQQEKGTEIKKCRNISEQQIYQKCVTIFEACYETYCHPERMEQFERQLLVENPKTEGEVIKVADTSEEKRESLHSMARILVDCVDYKKYEKKLATKESHAASIAETRQLWLRQDRDGQKKLSDSMFRNDEEEGAKEDADTAVREADNLGFLTSTRLVFTTNAAGMEADDNEQHVVLFRTSEVRDGYKGTVPLYNISNRPLYHLNTEEIKVIPPTDPPQKSKTNVVRMLLAPIITNVGMMFAMILGGSYGNRNSMIARCGIMAVITFGMTAWGYLDQRKAFALSVTEWKEHYQEYIRRVLKDIVNEQEQDIAQLKAMYPSMLGNDGVSTNTNNVSAPKLGNKIRNIRSKKMEHVRSGRKTTQNLVAMCEEVHPDIFSRGPEHPDFMTVRIGLSGENSQLVPSVFPIIGEAKESVFTAVRYQNIDGKNQDLYPFEIIMPEDAKKKVENRDYLINLPEKIAEKYGYLKKAPVLLNMKKCGTLGMVFPQEVSFYPFLDNLILNLCFYHSPDDLQIVLFCEGFRNQKEDLKYLCGETNCTDEWIYKQSVMDKYKHLPHFRELLGDLSAFAFSQKDANLIFNKLLEILAERKEQKNGEKYPQILLIFQDEYDFKRHPVSEYLPEYLNTQERKDYGVSFVFCKRYEEELPKYCGQVITGKKTNNNKISWHLMPHEQQILKEKQTTTVETNIFETNKQLYEFYPDNWEFPANNLDVKKERYAVFRAYKTLSALYYYRIAQGAGVPEFVSLFDLFINPTTNQREEFLNYTAENSKELFEQQLTEYIGTQWGMQLGELAGSKRDVTKTLAVPIGKKVGGEIVTLDLHEDADGPHMLVAGTTGSGKTETILTYLTTLCLLYTPEQVNLLLMDMKGAGFVKRIGKLPHVVGTVTDIDGDETDTSTVYMLKRFLHSMSAEIKRRKLLLSKLDVDSVDKYIEARNDLEAHLKKKKHLQGKRDELEKLPQIAHLFLVVDEFTELMRFSSDNSDVDFKSEITSLARIGRSLGFHIILISQNIENAITPDIKVNVSARLCLKVATREASKEMIGTDLAASPLMPGNGRAYLLVGTGSRFEYFQSGYSGAGIVENPERPYKMTCAEKSGRYTMFFNSEKREEIEKITQIEELSEMMKVCFKKSTLKKPRKVFQSPLPRGCYYLFDWDTKTGVYKEMQIATDEKKS